jgi:hypothetical protein
VLPSALPWALCCHPCQHASTFAPALTSRTILPMRRCSRALVSWLATIQRCRHLEKFRLRKRDRHDRVAEAAAPVLFRLCEKVKWPSDLFVPAGDCMEKRETSRPYSPFTIPAMPQKIGVRVGG